MKMAEEQTHSLTRKKIETEAEIQRVRASAIKVSFEILFQMKMLLEGLLADFSKKCIWKFCSDRWLSKSDNINSLPLIQ